MQSILKSGSHCAGVARQVTPDGTVHNSERRMDQNPVALLMTRPAGGNRRFLALLSPTTFTRVQTIESPLIRIDHVPGDLPEIGYYSAVFTSVNGVRFAPPPEDRLAFCLGEGTYSAAIAQGWRASIRGRDAASLLESLLREPPSCELIHFSGRHTRGSIVERLSAEGVAARRCIVYDQSLLPLSGEGYTALNGQQRVIAPLFSPRTAGHLARFVPAHAKMRPIAMSAAVAAALPLPWREGCIIASEPTLKAMAFEVEKRLAQDSLG